MVALVQLWLHNWWHWHSCSQTGGAGTAVVKQVVLAQLWPHTVKLVVLVQLVLHAQAIITGTDVAHLTGASHLQPCRKDRDTHSLVHINTAV